MAAERFGIREGDVYVDPLPLFYVGGQTVALEIVQPRATYVMLGAFDPGALLDLLETERATLTVAVPTVLLALLDDPSLPGRDLRALRSVSSGGAVVPAELVRRVGREIGASVTIVFGMTECSGFVSQTLLDDTPDDIAETIGSPLPGIETRVVDPDTGDDVIVGQVGELLVRGYNVMAGYHDRTRRNRRGLHSRRMVPHWRPRHRRRPRLSPDRGAAQGRRDLGCRERLPGRSGVGAARAPAGARTWRSSGYPTSVGANASPR